MRTIRESLSNAGVWRAGAERLHDVPRAIEGYRYVVGMWRHADPELQPFVAEARQGLERLTAEPRP